MMADFFSSVIHTLMIPYYKGSIMKRRWFVLLVFLIVLVCNITSISAAEIPNLVGNWSGSSVGYMEDLGYTAYSDGTFTVHITNQTERVFIGYIMKKDALGEEEQKVISGVLSADGTNVYLAEHDEGISLGTILGPDEIELTYLKPGALVYAGIDRLTRVQ